MKWRRSPRKNDAHSAHDRLERGRPVKRFKDEAFRVY
jgi:peptide chain release factor